MIQILYTCMVSLESTIKAQYAKKFEKNDWFTFKLVADYYLESAALLLKKDIYANYINDDLKLLIRNRQKRLFIGIGCELLLKVLYLKNGFCINLVIDNNGKKIMKKFPYLLNEFDKLKFKKDDTYTMNPLIQKIKKIQGIKHLKEIQKGLNIAKVFRNKEGHSSTLWHKYEPQNYIDIEHAIQYLYDEGFHEKLDIKIAFGKNQEGLFNIKN
ncbi:hypothetical protein KJA15_03530 [Patescibacteria group bacterium]|nr:hypothetical protein [Patescibacteria group bacterium]